MTTTENRERFELWATVRKDARRVIEREALRSGYATALAWATYDAATKSFDAAAAHQVCDYMAETYADAMAEEPDLNPADSEATADEMFPSLAEEDAAAPADESEPAAPAVP